MDGVEDLCYNMFEGCTSLKSVSIPGSVKEVPDEIFLQCSALTDVTVGFGVEELSVSAFSGCSSLETITIPGSVKDFKGIECTNLKTAVLGDGVETMSSSAFDYSKKTLANITIPGSMKLIDNWTFRDFESLASVTIKEGVEEIGNYAFHNCTSLNSVVIPGSVKTIGDNAFEGCTSLNKVEIQDGVEEIKARAFLDCPFSEIYIPESVTRIWGGSIGYDSIYEEDGTQREVKRDSVIIRGKFGSTAELYANSYGFTFKGDPVDPKSVAITMGKSAELEAGKKLQLETSLKPEFATTTFTWKSSNKKVATVNSKGLVKAVAKGVATITVTTKNGKTASIKVKVVAATPTRITINQGKSATLYMGSTLKLTTKFAPAKAESKLTWSSSKPAVATVSAKGVVTPKKAGKTKITVKTANGKKASITVKVVDVQSVKLKEGKGKTLKVGKKLALHATVSPAQVKTRLTWTSSDAKVAAVSDKGVVTAKKAGTAKITVKTANGKSATITITVK